MANETPGRRAHPWITLLGVIISLAGLTLAIGGGVLLAAGGSWYYLPAGLGLLVSGVLLARGRAAGAWWYWGVLAGTFLWTAWESGLDYWRWVPRVGLFVALGLLVGLAQWRLPGRFTRGVSRVLAGALVRVFVLAFALAFVPYGVTPAQGPLPTASSTPGTPSSITPQADGDWRAYGRGYAALGFQTPALTERSHAHHLGCAL